MPRHKSTIIAAYATEIHLDGINVLIAAGTKQKLESAVRQLTGIPGYDETMVDFVHISNPSKSTKTK
jgi:hypothetical protein